jgi:citrate lyase subunit beta/citryl-CoA lyase
MSPRSRDLPRRSCLSIPGSSEKMLGKGPNIPADMVFLDLEDAVAPKEKEASRARVATAIRTLDWGDKVLCVRVNDWSTKWTAYDIIEVVGNAGARLDEIMLPKVESAAQIVATDMLLRQVEVASGLPVGHIGIEAQIETARGLINVEEICAASPRLETIIFGPADFAASMEMPVLTGGVQIPDYPGDHITCSTRSSWRVAPTVCRSSTARTSTSVTPTASATTASARARWATTASGRCIPIR